MLVGSLVTAAGSVLRFRKEEMGSRHGGYLRIWFFSSHDVLIGSVDHPASYPVGTRGKGPVREAYHSLPTSAKVKNTWIYTSTLPYAFMAQCFNSYVQGQLYWLTSHRDKCTISRGLCGLFQEVMVLTCFGRYPVRIPDATQNILTEIFVAFPKCPGQISRLFLEIGHDHVLPYPSQFINH
jgi:hypothetical protein